MTDKPVDYEVELLHGKKIRVPYWSFMQRAEHMAAMATRDHFIATQNQPGAALIMREVVKNTLRMDDAALEDLVSGFDEYDKDINYNRIAQAIFDQQVMPLVERLKEERHEVDPPESEPTQEDDTGSVTS
jgi:hypothetical protein